MSRGVEGVGGDRVAVIGNGEGFWVGDEEIRDDAKRSRAGSCSEEGRNRVGTTRTAGRLGAWT